MNGTESLIGSDNVQYVILYSNRIKNLQDYETEICAIDRKAQYLVV